VQCGAVVVPQVFGISFPCWTETRADLVAVDTRTPVPPVPLPMQCLCPLPDAAGVTQAGPCAARALCCPWFPAFRAFRDQLCLWPCCLAVSQTLLLLLFSRARCLVNMLYRQHETCFLSGTEKQPAAAVKDGAHLPPTVSCRHAPVSRQLAKCQQQVPSEEALGT